MDNNYRPEEDKGLRCAGVLNTCIEILLGTGLMILVAVVLFTIARPYIPIASLPALLGLPAGNGHFML